ncbi:Ribose methyltransferase [Entophlyctis luteolus]|nr:Ribose methyltransferase [Entophlyctis luteolus]
MKELLHGDACVRAALAAARRPLFRVYLDPRAAAARSSAAAIRVACEAVKVPIVPSIPNSLKLVPHNGVALECGPLRVHAISDLSGLFDMTEYKVCLSAKEFVGLTFTPSNNRSFPLWLALDKIVDPQNLGAIIRSCAFFGVDGIVTTATDSSPFSPAVSKASAGAMESYETLFITKSLPSFLELSRNNGWTVYGTDLSEDAKKERKAISCWDLRKSSPASRASPTILVVGNEGDGIRKAVSKQCDTHLVIPGTRDKTSPFLDSLNVSVATGILVSSFQS